MIDLMATELTTQLLMYMSPYPDPRAHAVDAMSCDWKGIDAYLFPPWVMLGEVLVSKAGTRGVCGDIDHPTLAEQTVVPTPPGAPDRLPSHVAPTP